MSGGRGAGRRRGAAGVASQAGQLGDAGVGAVHQVGKSSASARARSGGAVDEAGSLIWPRCGVTPLGDAAELLADLLPVGRSLVQPGHELQGVAAVDGLVLVGVEARIVVKVLGEVGDS